MIAEEHREHPREDDHWDREDQVRPEQLPELRDMVSVSRVPAVPRVLTLRLMVVVGVLVVMCMHLDHEVLLGALIGLCSEIPLGGTGETARLDAVFPYACGRSHPTQQMPALW
ncbi:hypothetical protein ACFPRL_03870 [Pseudoclavibacter helvolus]